MAQPSAGIGLRTPHLSSVLAHIDQIRWVEIHTENLMVDGGPMHDTLENIVQHIPLSFHGIGLSLGSADGICGEHVQKIKKLVDYYQPSIVSEHVSWNQVDGLFLNDLLPVPYTEQALKTLVKNIDEFQHKIDRQVLIENPSSYLEYESSEMTEPEFIVELCNRANCKLLLDINNIYVSCENHGWNAKNYIDTIPKALVGEYHLAGHADVEIDGSMIKIDDHGSYVPEPVWELFGYTLKKIGPQMTLIEWDTNIPEIQVLVEIADKADKMISPYLRDNQAYAIAS